MSRDSLTGDGASADRYTASASAFRGLPGDLVLVFVYTVVVAGVIGLVGLGGVVRFVLGVPLLLFVPGYAMLSALFPGRPSRNAGQVSSLSGMSRRFTSMRSVQERGVRWGERAALSFGLSLFLVPLFALTLGLVTVVLGTGPLFRTVPVLVVLVVFTLVATLVGFVRRLRLPRAQRFAVPVGYWLRDFADGLTDSPVDALLNVVLVLAILVGTASMTYALAVPQNAETGSNYAVGTLDDSGTFRLGNYTTNLTVGQPQRYTVEVKNNEQRPVNYTVVIQLQRQQGGEVVSREELTRFSSPPVPANRTWQNPHTVTPTAAGTNLRVVYLFYLGDPPANPTTENADDAASLSVNVSSSGGGG